MMHAKNQKSQQQQTHWLRITLIVLIACAVAGTALSAARFFGDPDPTSASATIQLTFDGAAEGRAPNGSRYSMDGIFSDEVLSKALEASGLSGTYTTDQIRDHLRVSGSYPEDIVRQMMNYESLLDFSASRTLTMSQYFPTLYSVSLTSDFDRAISRENLEGLLKNIVETFRAHFISTFSCGLNAVEIEFRMDDFDYPQQLTIISRSLEDTIAYAEEMHSLAPTLTRGGKGFDDIIVQLNSLRDSELARLSANITMKALTNKVGRLVTQYQFEIRQLNNELEKKNQELEKLDQLVASYSKNEIIYLSTTDSVTRIDGNSSETYDSLVAARKDVADEITGIKSKISTYELQLADLLRQETESDASGSGSTAAETGTAAQTVSASAAESVSLPASEETETERETVPQSQLTDEELEAAAQASQEAAKARLAALDLEIGEVVAKREKIMTAFNDLLTAYNEQQMNDLTVSVGNTSYSAPKLLSGAFIRKTLKIAGPFCAVGFMVCMALIFISRRRQSEQ